MSPLHSLMLGSLNHREGASTVLGRGLDVTMSHSHTPSSRKASGLLPLPYTPMVLREPPAPCQD